MKYTNGITSIYTSDRILLSKDYFQEPLFIKGWDKNGNPKLEAYYWVRTEDRTIFKTGDVLKEDSFAETFLELKNKELSEELFADLFKNLHQKLIYEKVLFEIAKDDPESDIGETQELVYDFVKTVAVYTAFLKRKERVKDYCRLVTLFQTDEILYVWKGISWMPKELWGKAIKDYVFRVGYQEVNRMFMSVLKAMANL